MTVTVGGRALSVRPREAWRAVRDDVLGMSRGLKAWFAFLLVLCLIGGVAALLPCRPAGRSSGRAPATNGGS